MKYIFLMMLFIPASGRVLAQSATGSVVGEYYLPGIRETASGFRLNADSSFEFFFSQGALDRFGRGKWTIQDHKLILNSRKKPSNDFKLITSAMHAGMGITLKLADPHTNVLKYVYSMIKSGKKLQQGNLNDSGNISFNPQPIDSLILIFQFCLEKTSIFTNLNKQHNYFEFGFEPWLMELFFEDFQLQESTGQLTGPHPLLQGTSFSYKKSGSEK
jgi:hypothetical protein